MRLATKPLRQVRNSQPHLGVAMGPGSMICLLTRSTSHSVAARSGCTDIPLAAGGAQEDETILDYGFICIVVSRVSG